MIVGYIVWGAIATATFVLLWPSMWVSPLGTLARMGVEMERYVEGHVNPNYFMGRVVSDPGIVFYPIAYLFRSTPATLIGLLAAGVAVLRRKEPFDRPLVRRTVLGLTIFSLVFIALMTIPAKKFDRYILPAFLALDVVAAFGWVALAQAIARWTTRRRGATGDASSASGQPVTWQRGILIPIVVIFVGLAPLHGFFTALHAPYYLTYFNPLVGGSLTAPTAMIVGWGEGLDQAADWINRQPGAENMRAVAWYADGPFSYLFKGKAVSMGYSSPLAWLDVDYAVTYVNQWQRQLPSPEAIRYFQSQKPVYTVRSGGIELANVYDMKDVLLPPFVGFNSAAAADFGDTIRLAGHKLDALQLNPGDSAEATFYLQGRAPIQTNFNILVRLTGADGQDIWRAEGWPWGAPTSGWPVRDVRPDGHQVVIPARCPARPLQADNVFV